MSGSSSFSNSSSCATDAWLSGAPALGGVATLARLTGGRPGAVFEVGAGSGGVRLARMSASMGAKVAVAEDRELGGTCVNVGCVPKKLFVYASHVPEELEDGAGFGWSHDGALKLDWPTLVANKNKEVTNT